MLVGLHCWQHCQGRGTVEFQRGIPCRPPDLIKHLASIVRFTKEFLTSSAPLYFLVDLKRLEKQIESDINKHCAFKECESYKKNLQYKKLEVLTNNFCCNNELYDKLLHTGKSSRDNRSEKSTSDLRLIYLEKDNRNSSADILFSTSIK